MPAKKNTQPFLHKTPISLNDNAPNITLPSPKFWMRRTTFSPFSRQKTRGFSWSKDEQAFLDARKVLFQDMAFKSEIRALQEKYPVDFFQEWENLWERKRELGHRISEACDSVFRELTEKFVNVPVTITYPVVELALVCESRQLCKRWGFEGEEWVIWLVKEWDTQCDEPPSFGQEPKWFPPRLHPCSLTLDKFCQRVGPSATVQATITLRAGASAYEARQAVTRALKALGASKRAKAKRPGVTDYDRELLRKEFSKQGLPKRKNEYP